MLTDTICGGAYGQPWLDSEMPAIAPAPLRAAMKRPHETSSSASDDCRAPLRRSQPQPPALQPSERVPVMGKRPLDGEGLPAKRVALPRTNVPIGPWTTPGMEAALSRSMMDSLDAQWDSHYAALAAGDVVSRP